MNLYNAQQCQQLDKTAQTTLGVPGILLMKRAAHFAFQHLKNRWPEAKSLYVVCGTGNNGGDGFVLAENALIEGFQVKVCLLGNASHLKNDALSAYQSLIALGQDVSNFSENELQQADVLVDAIFGIGLNRPIEGEAAQAVQKMNLSSKPILALDVPSGLDANTGTPLGVCIQADLTASFIAAKFGLLTGIGADNIGELHISDLNIPLATFKDTPALASLHSIEYWQQKRPVRSKSSHKGTSGTVLLIGGNRSMVGAIQLAGNAALRAGSGLVKIISQPEHLLGLSHATPELMCYDDSAFSSTASLAKALAIGPGLGQDAWAKKLFQQTLHWQLDTQRPLVIDADALILLAQSPSAKKTSTPVMRNAQNWVLTPHPGEAAMMLGCSTETIQQDRLKAIQQLHQHFGGVVILKGNGSLIYDGKQLELCPLGNPGMATGGMGDVLTGMIVSYLGQGMTLFNAACLGVYQHAYLADQCVMEQTETSLLPSDIINRL